MRKLKFFLPVLLLLMSLPLGVVFADDYLEVSLSLDYTCDEVGIEINTDTGTGPFSLTINFGDEDEPVQIDVEELPHLLSHTYPGPGEYEISVKVIDSLGLEGEAEKEILIEGPEVTLGSDPFPPLLTLESGEATVVFTAIVEGENDPFTFQWDLDGDDIPEPIDPTADSAEFTYTESNKYKAKVTVTDDCGFSDSDKLTVVILDDEEDEDDPEDGEKACHPMAERIAQAVSSLGGGSGQYTCEDIYKIFRTGINGTGTIGFGRLWQAYKLASVIPELSWEEIRDWKLDGNSWGLLNQISKFAETIDDVGIRELFDLVLTGENSVAEIRTAMRMALRYEADFEDALGRIGEGASKGELGQFYRLAQDLGVDPVELDEYLEGGASLSEIRHAGKLSERLGSPLDEILNAHDNGSGWGEINQAYRLAEDGASLEEILSVGVNEYRKQLRAEERLELTTEREQGIAVRLGEKYGSTPEDVLNLYNGVCEWKWACVRKLLREGDASIASTERDARMLEKISNQFGVSQEEVSFQLSVCSGDWSCVRAHFRELSKPERGKK